MKQTLTFIPSIIASTASKMNVDSFDASVEAFDNKAYLQSFYALLDYINPEFRTKYGNTAGDEFSIPHGSIVVNLKLEKNQLFITAPFLALPEKGKVPLLRQIAGLNFNNLDLTRIMLKNDQLYFEYSCPMELVEPYKVYYVLEELCLTGDKYDDEFGAKFGAKRIYEPKVTPFDSETINTIFSVIQQSCKEGMEGVNYFEASRKYGFAWNIISCTLLKILYYAHPQGQLLNDLKKAVYDLDREDIPLPEIVISGKAVIERIQGMSKELLAENLYSIETFIPSKRRSNLKNIQENFEDRFNDASQASEQGDYLKCCVMIVYQFYRLYYYNNVQDDINTIIVNALQQSSAKPWEEAAPILLEAMGNIMEGNLTPVINPMEGIDMSSYMAAVQQNLQQTMQGLNMEEITKNFQNMMGNMLGGTTNSENSTNSEK